MNIVLVGIGGYGSYYLEALLQGKAAPFGALSGAVDPRPESSPHYSRLLAAGIPVCSSLDEYFSIGKADLTIISSPIQFHAAQTCLALSRGSHVLCEKPVSATVGDAKRMIEARDKANKLVAIGYQWSYSESMQALKRDIAAGRFGKPVRLKTLLLWPRSNSYYARAWAGKIRDADGQWILDSVANNATAHYIHNMFFVLGGDSGLSARPSAVTAELYRANRIENYDTAAMRAYTEDGTELLYFGSHAVNRQGGTRFCYQFEHADIVYDDRIHDGVTVRFRNGERKEYASPESDRTGKLDSVIAAVRGEPAVICTVEAAMSHTMCIEGMQRSSAIHPFPEYAVRRDAPLPNNEEGVYVEGLADQLEQCYERGALPSEIGWSWAAAGKEVAVSL